LILLYFRKSAEKIPVSLKSDMNNGTLLEGQNTFLVLSRSDLLKTKNVFREKIKAHFYVQ